MPRFAGPPQRAGQLGHRALVVSGEEPIGIGTPGAGADSSAAATCLLWRHAKALVTLVCAYEHCGNHLGARLADHLADREYALRR